MPAWARQFRDDGHEVRLIAPQFVKPYVKSNKNDAIDAEAICEAVQRPNSFSRFGFAETFRQGFTSKSGDYSGAKITCGHLMNSIA